MVRPSYSNAARSSAHNPRKAALVANVSELPAHQASFSGVVEPVSGAPHSHKAQPLAEGNTGRQRGVGLMHDLTAHRLQSWRTSRISVPIAMIIKQFVYYIIFAQYHLFGPIGRRGKTSVSLLANPNM
ncbi:MAG: hypothetical protein CBC67_02660 [Gammaproteobacteria bacterium TMED107]|nr:hypothetical protein [Gammaproteobacteria bacterium]OUX76534.1 MAG: hypothetical protein CBC67_02660 [Gammaproteobacteria bacterium TMED107]